MMQKLTSAHLAEVQVAASDIELAMEESRDSFQKFLAFVKTFDKDEFGTIYCEREWRSVESFTFSYDDLAMIVLPKGREFENFISDASRRLGLPRRIPLVTWEDLVES